MWIVVDKNRILLNQSLNGHSGHGWPPKNNSGSYGPGLSFNVKISKFCP